ncbi:MAG: TRAP transporter substrate-binding protein DctP [Thermodesulfobacteriota bacterium]
MKQKTWIAIWIILFFFVGMPVSGLQIDDARAAEKTYRMKIQSAFPHGDLSMDLLKEFAASAEKRSDGRLKIRVFADPELVPGDQLLGATKQGVLDMLHAMGGMWAGILPIGNVEFNLPLAFHIEGGKTFEEKAEIVRDFFFSEGFIELLRQEYAKQGLYYLDIHTYGPVPFVLSTKPIKTCEDMKGMKIRAEGINLEYHAGVGFQSTVISGLETYMALKLGTVDAAEWDVSAVTGLNWHEVAPYWIRGMESDITVGHILVDMDEWEKLPDDMKAALKGAAEDYWHATVKGYKKELATVRKLVDEGKIQINVLDEACQQKYAEVAHKIWEEVAIQSPANAKAIEMIRDWKQNQ